MILLNVDSQTWIITIVGWLIVFAALVVLILVFTLVPKVLKFKYKRNPKSKGEEVEFDANDNKYISGDETAAIAMALHLYFDEQHDEESNVI
ncbi:MAG: OadG family protein, partial [Prolixibacteraceae bacterium]|nr:OadG family protein [Prolixibacteraceae bacterium]